MAITPSNAGLTDPAAISANRDGRFTPWQRLYLKPPSLVVSTLALVFFAVLVVLGAYFFIVLPLSTQPLSTSDLTILWPFLGIYVVFLLVISTYLLVPNLRRLLTKLRLRHDLAEGLIAQDDGQVGFGKKHGYIARTSWGALSSLDGAAAVDLAPGAYHFFYLPLSRRLLSAERQEIFEPDGPQAGLLAALAEANGFSLDELEMNRQGRLSGRQRLKKVRGLFFILVLLAAIVIGGVVSALHTNLLVIIVFALVALFIVFLLVRSSLDVLEGRVVSTDGLVHRIKDTTDGVDYYYTVEKLKFRVGERAFAALVTGERYRVYYLPRSKQFVSIEPLP